MPPRDRMASSFAEIAALQQRGQSAAASCSPEFELLLCCARTVPDAARIEALTDATIDWRALLDLSREHNVRPPVWQALHSTCWDRVPENIRVECDEAYRSFTGRNLLLTSELLRVTAAFDEAGLRVAVMKGAAIAQMAYGDFALREFGDFDLLIRPDDFFRATELLQQLGYNPEWKCGDSTAFHFLRYVGEYKLTRDVMRTDVDLHWRVVTKATALAPSLSDFPSGFKPVSLAGSTVLSFAPQDLPLYLAAQGGWDQWSDLRRICDLAEFLRRYPEIDLEPTLALAQRLGGLRSMLVGLFLASKLLGADLPEPVVRRIHADAAIAELAETATHNLLRNVHAGEPVSRYVFQLKAKQGLWGKIALAYSILFERTAEDANWIMLPRPLWWLYFLLRPLRIGLRMLRLA